MEMDSEHLGEYKFVHTCTFACKRSHKNYFYYFFLQFEYLHFGQNVKDYSHFRATITCNLS